MDFLRDRPELVLFVCGALLLVLVLRRRAAAYFRRQASAPPATIRATAPLEAPCSNAELARWEVYMRETARELAAQLDSKSSVLLALVSQAREERRLLEETLRNSAGAGQGAHPA